MRSLAACPRRGFTLVELLVVIFIVLSITVATIPVILPAIENRQMRETARLVNGYLADARAQAMRSGRSAGVLIERPEDGTNAATVLAQCEVPLPWAGDSMWARGVIGETAGTYTFDFVTPQISWLHQIRAGDLIKLNYQGRTYRLDGGPLDEEGHFEWGSLPWNLEAVTPGDPPPPVSTNVPFQIIRQPVRTAAQPLTLPPGICIDLDFSGWGNTNGFATGSESVIVLFAPDGSLAAVFSEATGTWQAQRLTAAVHLLVGRREKAGSRTGDVNDNLGDLSNRWVSIQHRTGLVSTTENLGGNSTVDPADLPNELSRARQLAILARGMGGR